MAVVINANFGINTDVNKIFSQIGATLERSSLNDRRFDHGRGRFISCQSNGKVYSIVYHESKPHSGTAQVENRLGHVIRSAKCDAPPGKWCVAYTKSGTFGGDKTYYNY